MSRKREQQRESKRELARQLGVSGKDVPTNLIENERVTEPRLQLSTLTATVAKRGFFEKPKPLSLAVALFCVDARGARVVRRVSGVVVVDQAGSYEVKDVKGEGDDVVRYRRPGHFVVVVVAGGSIEDDCVVVHGGVRVGVGSVEVGRGKAAESVVVAGALAASLVSIDVVDRVKTTLALPLVSPDGRFAATLAIDVRL
jgi:hypothetical protein